MSKPAEYDDLGTFYGVDPSTIRRIRRDRGYLHLKHQKIREAIEAEIVAWLRDCTLSSAIPDDPAQIVADIASAIESGEYRSKSD